MCSKKWAKPDLPGSTSFREPVFTGIWIDTMFGKPVGTTMIFSPFGRVLSEPLKGRRSRVAGEAAGSLAAVAPATGVACCAVALAATRARRTAAGVRKRGMKASPFDSRNPTRYAWDACEVSPGGAYRGGGTEFGWTASTTPSRSWMGRAPSTAEASRTTARWRPRRCSRWTRPTRSCPGPNATGGSSATSPRPAGPWSAPRSGTRSGRCEGTRTGSLSFWRSFERAPGSPPWTGGSTSSRRDSPPLPRTASSGSATQRALCPGSTRRGGERSSRGALRTGPRRIRRFRRRRPGRRTSRPSRLSRTCRVWPTAFGAPVRSRRG